MEAMDVEKQIDMSLDDVIKQMGKARGGRSSKQGRRRGRLGDKTDGAETNKDAKRRRKGHRGGQRDKRGVVPGVSGGIKKSSGGQAGKVPLVVKPKATNAPTGGRATAGLKVGNRRRERRLSSKGIRRMPAHLLPKKVAKEPTRDNASNRGASKAEECTLALLTDNSSKRAVQRTIAQAKAVLARAEEVLQHKKAASTGAVQPRNNKPKLQLPKKPALPKPRDSTAPTPRAGPSAGGARGGARGPRLPLPRDRVVRLPSGAVMPSKMASDQPGRAALRPVGGVSKSKSKQSRGSKMTLSERFSRVDADRRDDGNSRRRSSLVMP